MGSRLNDDAQGDGEFIASTDTNRLPRWMLYLVSVPALLLGFTLLIPTLPGFLNKRQGDLTGAVAGSVVCAVLITAGVLAIWKARKGRISKHVDFYTDGIANRYDDGTEDFWEYQDLSAIDVSLAPEPHPDFRGLEKYKARVSVTFEDHRVETVYIFPQRKRQQIADCAARRRERKLARRGKIRRD
ncbi:MAG: hypothetical protein KDA88_15980 [Planctomycetaceae bacterium]|nr:hypothetical protein [Planctomycetaceae bacterium]